LNKSKFYWDKDPVIADEVKKLVGKPVEISAFMAPLDEYTKMREFLALRQSVGCFYCEAPSPTQVILVNLKSGLTAEIVHTAVKLRGTLALSEESRDEFLYTLNDAEIISK